MTEDAGLHVGGLPIGPVRMRPLSPAWVDGARCAEWLAACHHARLD